MSTGCMNLDILLDQILSDALAGANESVRAIQRRYPSLSEREASEIFSMISSAAERNDDSAELIITASPSFALRVKPTKVVVNAMLSNAKAASLLPDIHSLTISAIWLIVSSGKVKRGCLSSSL